MNMKYQNVVYGIEMSDPVARLILASLGAAITLSSGAVLTYPMFLPEIRRRERVVVDWVNKRGKELGLKSRFTFGFSDWSPGGSVGGGSYEPSGEEDRDLFDRIGGQLEGEGIDRANRMVWSDRTLGVVGLALLVLGAAVGIASAVA